MVQKSLLSTVLRAPYVPEGTAHPNISDKLIYWLRYKAITVIVTKEHGAEITAYIFIRKVTGSNLFAPCEGPDIKCKYAMAAYFQVHTCHAWPSSRITRRYITQLYKVKVVLVFN